MVWLPPVKAVAVHAATPVLAFTFTGEVQPVVGLPLSVKVTEPPNGTVAEPVVDATVAVKVTD